MFFAILNAYKTFINHIKNQIKYLTRPAVASIAAGTLSDLPRSKADLIVDCATCHFASTGYCPQPICETAETLRWWPYALGVAFPLDELLALCCAHCATRDGLEMAPSFGWVVALTSGPLSSLLETGIQVQEPQTADPTNNH